jgi:hypothetical protein
VLPLSFDGATLTVVLSAPPTSRTLDELRLIFDCPISTAIAHEDDILAAIYRHYHPVASERTASPTAISVLRQSSTGASEAAEE